MSPPLIAAAAEIVRAYTARGWRIATAESCTGGLVAALITQIAGASAVFERGFVTYSNEAKAEMIGVPGDLILRHGAVSEPVARAMATGAVRAARVEVAVSITGVAGPGGGSEEKPVGLVHLACATASGQVRHVERRYGDLGRATIRERAAEDALALLRQALAETP